MVGILFLGFGERVKFNGNYRVSWVPHIRPERDYPLTNYNAVIINLTDFRKINDKFLERFNKEIKKFLMARKVLIYVTGIPAEGNINYYLLPFPWAIVKVQRTHINIYPNIPIAIRELFRNHDKNIAYVTEFIDIPPSSQTLASNGYVISFMLDHGNGKIILVPPVYPILYGCRSSEEEEIKRTYLEDLVSVALSFVDLSEERPEWLDEVKIFDEEKIQEEYDRIESKLLEYYDLKSILNDSGVELTRKVDRMFSELGFDTEEKEIEGKEDILISHNGFEGIIECSGSNGYFNIEDLDQLIRYISRTGKKGIYVGNAFKQVKPEKRNPEKTFTDEVKRVAKRLEICLITVPQLFEIYLRIKDKPELKARYREIIKKCKVNIELDVSSDS